MNRNVNNSPIPVRNLYFMLAYVCGYPNQIYKVEIDKNYDEDFINLLSKVIIKKFDVQIKRSRSDNYIKDLIENDGMESKVIDFEVIQQSKDIHPGFSYMNDFLNHDNIYNQIIKRTLTLLMNYRYLKDEYEWTMVDIYNYLRKVSYIKIDKTVFDGLVMHKYNKSYEYLVKLCEFIWCELDISDSCGKSEFLDLTKEPQKLNDFITRFVKVFYKQELLEHPKSDLVIDINTIDFTNEWETLRIQLNDLLEK